MLLSQQWILSLSSIHGAEVHTFLREGRPHSLRGVAACPGRPCRWSWHFCGAHFNVQSFTMAFLPWSSALKVAPTTGRWLCCGAAAGIAGRCLTSCLGDDCWTWSSYSARRFVPVDSCTRQSTERLCHMCQVDFFWGLAHRCRCTCQLGWTDTLAVMLRPHHNNHNN